METWRQQDIESVYGRYVELPDTYPLERIWILGSKRVKRLRPLGLHSDDTQQAMAALLVAQKGWSAEAWGALLAEGKRRKAWRGVGRNFVAAMRRLMRGVPPQSSGSPSAGMGAVMRVGPLGALLRENPEGLARAATESAATTHADLRALAFSHAIAWSVSELVNGRPPREVAAGVGDSVRTVELRWLEGNREWLIETEGRRVSELLNAFFVAPPRRPELVRERVARVVGEGHPNQGFVALGGLHALGVALSPTVEPQLALEEIVNLGYDTDTVAAIAGSLLGARFGSEWIPVERLVDGERLLRYAESLVTGDPPETVDAFLTRESELTRQEENYQAEL